LYNDGVVQAVTFAYISSTNEFIVGISGVLPFYAFYWNTHTDSALVINEM